MACLGCILYCNCYTTKLLKDSKIKTHIYPQFYTILLQVLSALHCILIARSVLGHRKKKKKKKTAATTTTIELYYIFSGVGKGGFPRWSDYRRWGLWQGGRLNARGEIRFSVRLRVLFTLRTPRQASNSLSCASSALPEPHSRAESCYPLRIECSSL